MTYKEETLTELLFEVLVLWGMVLFFVLEIAGLVIAGLKSLYCFLLAFFFFPYALFLGASFLLGF